MAQKIRSIVGSLLGIKKMKEFNKELHNDIALLKTMHAKKDKQEFNLLKSEIMQKHKISKATVYREMNKDTPGMYKIPNYNPPSIDITTLEALMVRELLLAGKQNKEIIKIMARELGIPYNWDRFDRVRRMAEKLDEAEYDPGKSYFPMYSDMFFERLLGLEFMAGDTYKEVDVNGCTIKICKDTLEMIKIYLMRDNPMDGKKRSTDPIIAEIIFHSEMDEGLRRKSSHMNRTGEIPSAYALRSMQETKELLNKRKGTLLRIREEVLKEQNKWTKK